MSLFNKKNKTIVETTAAESCLNTEALRNCPHGSDGSTILLDNGIPYVLTCDEYFHCDKECYNDK